MTKLLELKDKKISGLKEEKYTNNREISFLRNENTNLINKINMLKDSINKEETDESQMKEEEEEANVEENDYLHKSYLGDAVSQSFDGAVIEEVEFGEDVLGLADLGNEIYN